MIVSSKGTTVLRQEVLSLLRKGAIEDVHPSQMKSGFYSRYFVVPKKVTTNIGHLNLALRMSKFKMLTVKSILSQIQPNVDHDRSEGCITFIFRSSEDTGSSLDSL